MFTFYLYLLAVHYLADFICQTHWQAANKSKRNDALFSHTVSYTVIMTCFVIVTCSNMYDVQRAMAFSFMTFGTHTFTDYFTSRASAARFGLNWHNFFVVIGLDQLIHQLTLAATMWWCFYA